MVSLENRFNVPSPLGFRWRSAWFSCRLTGARWLVFSFVCLVTLAISVSTQLHAQQGLPIVQQTGMIGNNAPSPIFVDANQFLSQASGDGFVDSDGH